MRMLAQTMLRNCEFHRLAEAAPPVLLQVPCIVADMGKEPFHFFFIIKILREKKTRIPTQEDISDIKDDVHVSGSKFSNSGAYIMMAWFSVMNSSPSSTPIRRSRFMRYSALWRL